MDNVDVYDLFYDLIEDLKRAIDGILGSLETIAEAFIEAASGEELYPIMSPRQYGMAKYKNKRKEAHYGSYRVDRKVQRNLPYQRRGF